MFLIKEGSKDGNDDTFIEIKITDPEASTPPKLKFFHLDKTAAEWIYKNDVTEKSLIYWAIENFAKKDKNILDIGAHLGIYTWTFAKYCNHVYSFECNPKTFCYLAANVALHNVTENVTLFNNALGNEETVMDYYIRSEDGGDNGFIRINDKDSMCKKLPIQIKKLDSFNLTNIGFIKIDVEGFEKQVLEGGIDTLKNNNYPPILFESWNEGRDHYINNRKEIRDNLFSFITSLGYNIHNITGVYNEIFLATKS